MKSEEQRMGLWQFAIDFYGRDGVASSCLSLQDSVGVDVNVLIYAIWRSALRGQQTGHIEVAFADAGIIQWRQDIVLPLRSVRRRLKTGPRPAPGGVTDKLRNSVKAAELAAEKIEIEFLEGFAESDKADDTACDRLELVKKAIGAVIDYFADNGGLDTSDSVAALLATTSGYLRPEF